jgi:enoyl-CoA hydratase/carnithine racemase
VAGGLEVACWADLRVAAEGSVFGVFCRRFGVPLIDLGTIRLPRLIGASRAMDLILTGRPVAAREAHDIGLANYLTPQGGALDKALRLALDQSYPTLRAMKLRDYKVRILESAAGTGARTRVLIESGDGHRIWGTVGVSDNIIDASWEALRDSVEYMLSQT